MRLPRPRGPRYNSFMEWLWAVGIFAGYVVLMKWVLPRLGVST